MKRDLTIFSLVLAGGVLLAFAASPNAAPRPWVDRATGLAWDQHATGVRLVFGHVSHDATVVADQNTQATSVVRPTSARAIRFVCNQQTLPNDMASCINRAVRLYFEGDWSSADLCDATGERCHNLGKLLAETK